MLGTATQKINKGIIATFAILTMYLITNIIEIVVRSPIHITIKNISIIDVNKNIVIDNVPQDKPIMLKKNQDVLVSFYIVRNYIGYNSIERVFELPGTNMEPKSEIIMSYTRRPATYSADNVIAEYNIPNYVKPGCGYTIYSRNTIEYRYNIMQRLFGTIIDSPRLKICILKE